MRYRQDTLEILIAGSKVHILLEATLRYILDILKIISSGSLAHTYIIRGHRKI